VLEDICGELHVKAKPVDFKKGPRSLFSLKQSFKYKMKNCQKIEEEIGIENSQIEVASMFRLRRVFQT
jgi:hypothetical protein